MVIDEARIPPPSLATQRGGLKYNWAALTPGVSFTVEENKAAGVATSFHNWVRRDPYRSRFYLTRRKIEDGKIRFWFLEKEDQI